MITGVTRTYAQTMREVRRVIDHAEGKTPFGMHIWVGQQQTIFIADSTVNERPSAEMLADIAERTAQVARRMGHEPRVAFLSSSNFGNPPGSWLGNIRDDVHILDERQPEFDYEGAIAPDVPIHAKLRNRKPFCPLARPE